jgi:ribosome-associated protein
VIDHRQFSIRGETITLGQLLKAAGCVQTGGDAKTLLAEGLVQVNGEVEQRRGRQLRAGDIVVVSDEDAITIV